jgi:parallel beta-helix repeat protein
MSGWSGKGRRRLTAALGTAAALVAAIAGLSSGGTASAVPTTVYVDGGNPNCSDSGTGLPTAPYCTIVQAAKKAVAGQAVQVAAGTYSGEVAVYNSGTATAPIRFAPAPGATVVVTGGRRGFYLSKRSYVTVSRFTTSGTENSGLYVVNSDHVTLSDNEVRFSGQPNADFKSRGVYVSGSTDVLVIGNHIHHNTDSGIYLTGTSTRVRVEGNDIHDNARQYERAAAGIDVRSPGNTIIGNRAHDNEDTGVSVYPGGDNTVVVNNASFHNRGASGQTGMGDHGIDNLGVSGGVVVGNTVFDNVTSGINVEGSSIGATVVNNLSVDNGINSPRTTSNIRVDATSATGAVVDYNVVHLDAGLYNYIWGSGWYKTQSAFNAATGQEAHGLQGNPGWADPANGDFTLTLGSPAIDSANSGAPGAEAVDGAGVARVDQAATPNTGAGPRDYDDRGAYELAS